MKFKLNRYRYYILTQAFVVISVIALFETLPSKQIASVFASGLFLTSSLGIVYYEYKNGWRFYSGSFWVTSFFLTIFVLPIFLMRLLNWEVPFSDIEMFGLKPDLLHRLSNQFFIFVLLSYFIDSFRFVKRSLK